MLERVENKLLSMVLPLDVEESSITRSFFWSNVVVLLLASSRAIALVKFCGSTVR